MAKVILVTGASRGIGLATAQALLARGHTVFGTSRHPENWDVGVKLLPLDVTNDESALICVEKVMRRAGRLDVLVNNAGVSLFGALEETSISEARALFETNFFGMMRMVNVALPAMRAQAAGQIINISSIAGIIGVPYLGLYAASKHALEGYSEALRYETRYLGINVSIIQPGDIRTTIDEPDAARRIDAYATVRDRVFADHARSMREAPPPEIVAALVVKIIESRRPRLRYAVGRGAYVPLFKRLTPAWLAEPLVRRFFKLNL